MGLRRLRVASLPEDISRSTYALLLCRFLTPWPAIPTFLILCFSCCFNVTRLRTCIGEVGPSRPVCGVWGLTVYGIPDIIPLGG